jgi:hypothetical protein
MSNLLPAIIKRIWVVDARGTTVEQKPPTKALTSGQRHYYYRLGLMAVDQFLKQRGFISNCSESQTTLSYEKAGVWLDIRVKRPDNIAYVTSYPGYEYRQELTGRDVTGQEMYGVRAKVITAKEIMGSDYIVQVMVSTHNYGTCPPVFIPLPKTLDNPARYVLHNVLGTIALACSKIPRVQEAFNKDAVHEAQARPIDELINERHLPLLPD